MKFYCVLIAVVIAAVPMHASERNRMAKEHSSSIAVSGGSAVDIGHDETAAMMVSLSPFLSVEANLTSAVSLWMVIPAVLLITVDDEATYRLAGGIGDIRTGISLRGSLRSYNGRIGLGLSVPSGIGDRYRPRALGYSSGNGEYILYPSAGLAYVWDPVALRGMLEVGIRPVARPGMSYVATGRLQSAVTILLNRLFALEGIWTTNCILASRSFESTAGVSVMVMPAPGHLSFTVTYDFTGRGPMIEVVFGIQWSGQ